VSNNSDGAGVAGVGDETAFAALAGGTEGTRTALERNLLGMLHHAPTLMFIKDTEYRYLFVNQAYLDFGPYTPAQMLGNTDHDFHPRHVADHIRILESEVLASGRAIEREEEFTLPERGLCHFVSIKFPARDERGALIGVAGIVTDITDMRRREAQRFAEQQRLIEAQQDALRELSTPLLPIADGVLAVPLVGALGPRRAQELLDTLLHGITTLRARVAILDVTGIREIDGEVAASLIHAARAARLVGAEVMLTGISPHVAQTLVSLGTDLSGITTLATLASGIERALGHQAGHPGAGPRESK
jgi:rsbT co-antagonist protein RsbR